MESKHTSLDLIRNFTIIAHIDHGKSTLADRMLEETGTIEKRKMKDQVLDSMDIERERGITIKMTPVSMLFEKDHHTYHLNLIDTPGHIDFSYEVSRALKSVEGAILLIDATQGVQAQTLSVLAKAEEFNLKIIPVVTKIDSNLAMIDETKEEIARLLNIDQKEVMEVSGRTGQGVRDLLEKVIKVIPAPVEKIDNKNFKSLIFDFEYSNHEGIIIFARVYGGEVKRGDSLVFRSMGKKFQANEVGVFLPEKRKRELLAAGEIGYITTGIKEPGVARVGDTVSSLNDKEEPLKGFMEPKPIIWASIYPESQDDFEALKQILLKLKLYDSALSFAEESSTILGRGFQCGFLGMLHLEIIVERIKRESKLEIVVTAPSIKYKVILKGGEEKIIHNALEFPETHLIEKVYEPWVKADIITPEKYVSPLLTLLHEYEGIVGDSETFSGGRIRLLVEMPLRELMRNFFDELKSRTSGFASLSYEEADMKEAFVSKLEVLVAEETVPAFSRIISSAKVSYESEKIVEKLEKLLPREQFTVKIQAKANGRILASRTLKALRKDVTGYLYGGDITRKRKLWEKQKKGKKKLQKKGRVNIPAKVFTEIVKN